MESVNVVCCVELRLQLLIVNCDLHCAMEKPTYRQILFIQAPVLRQLDSRSIETFLESYEYYHKECDLEKRSSQPTCDLLSP